KRLDISLASEFPRGTNKATALPVWSVRTVSVSSAKFFRKAGGNGNSVIDTVFTIQTVSYRHEGSMSSPTFIQRHYLACDLGAESGRLIVGTLVDKKLSLQEVHRFPN